MPYAYVNSTEGSGSLVLSITPTAGNLLIWVSNTSGGAGDGTITGVQDSTSAAWTQGFATYQEPNGNLFRTCFYKENCAAGITSVTATIDGVTTPGTCDLAVIQYSGIATSAALITQVKADQNTPGTTANALSSGATSVTVSGAAAVVGIVWNSGGSDTTAGTGYTSRLTGSDKYFVEDKRITSTGSNTVTATAPTRGGIDFYTTLLIAFNEPSESDVLMPQICL